MPVGFSDERFRRGIDHLFNDEIEEAHEDFVAMGLDKKFPAHCYGRAYIQFLRAIMTFEAEHIDKARELLAELDGLCRRVSDESCEKRGGWMTSRVSSVESVAADALYGEAQLLGGVLQFLGDSVLGFVKGGLMVRNSFKTFQACEQYIQEDQGTVDVGTRGQALYGVGLYDVLLSLLPPSGTRVVGMFGMGSGDVTDGVRKLARVYREGGYKAPFAAITLLHFHVILASHMAFLGEDPPTAVAEHLLARCEAEYPLGGIFGCMRGRLLRMQGRLTEAVARFDALSGRVGWVEMDHMAWYEAAWALLLDGRFDLAARLWDTLCKESKWSKAFYAYMAAVSLWATPSPDIAVVRERFASVKGFIRKKGFGGNVPPVEEYACARSEEYLGHGRLLFPVDELVMMWNSFSQQRHRLDSRIAAVDAWLLSPEGSSADNDQIALAHLLRGSMLAATRSAVATGRADLARRDFELALSLRKSVRKEKHVEPYCRYELALMYWRSGNKADAEKYLSKAKACKNYYLEPRLGFRINAVTQRMARSSDAIIDVADVTRPGDPRPGESRGVVEKAWRGGNATYGLGLGVDFGTWGGEEKPELDGEDAWFTAPTAPRELLKQC